jgi:hypothetical protein
MAKSERLVDGVRRYVLVDIDHTLSAAWPRDHMIGTVPWDEYHAASHADLPVEDIKNLVNALYLQGFITVALTARPERWRALTNSWFIRHGIFIEEMLMRADDEYRPSPAMKLELVKARFGEALPDRVAFLLEDRDDVCSAFKELGITVLQIHGRRT